MRVALVSSDGRCGIAEHSNLLVQSVRDADPGIEFVRDAAWLDPLAMPMPLDYADVLHLNFHRGLHSRWTPDVVARVARKTVITFHDTYETQPDSLPWDLLDVCDALVVHEPCDLSSPLKQTKKQVVLSNGSMGATLEQWQPDAEQAARAAKVHYWRQGVPEPHHLHNQKARDRLSRESFCRPIVGTCGFAFPWKGFELLCDAAAQVGWGVLICSHNATDAQCLDWEARNPWVEVDRSYLSTPDLVARLGTCDATAFLYQCMNSGTSGAIRVGIAAGKPVLAAGGCRQFRDLVEMGGNPNEPSTGILWTPPTVRDVGNALIAAGRYCGRFDPMIVNLRERDSWRHLGQKYAALYRSLVS